MPSPRSFVGLPLSLAIANAPPAAGASRGLRSSSRRALAAVCAAINAGHLPKTPCDELRGMVGIIGGANRG